MEPIQQNARLLDIGTGAGFPGIPLKIARKDLCITLIEPVQKKVSFLYSIVGLLRLEHVKIFYGTLEQFSMNSVLGCAYDYMTSRALRYDVMLREGRRLLGHGGRAIIYSSHVLDSQQVGGWSFVNQREFDLPRGLGHRVISVLEQVEENPAP